MNPALTFFIIGTIVLSIASITLLFIYDNSVKASSINNTDVTLEDEAKLLHSELMTFYKYNYSNLGKELTNEQLLNEGGVCWHYANWYIDNAKEDNFQGKLISYDYGGDVGHTFAMIYSSNGYCILDQSFEPECRRLI